MVYVVLFVIVISIGMWFSKHSKSKALAAIQCLIMVCVSGLRHGYVDTRAYRNGFIILNVKNVLSWDYIINDESKGKGFSVLSAIIKVFTDNSQAFLFIMSLITVSCLFWGIVNRVNQIDLGIFLLISTGCYLDTMNGVRQALVAAILFWMLPKLMIKKEFVKYMAIVIILSTVHSSALVFIPIYFIASKKAWSKYTYALIGICLVVYILFNSGISAFLVDMLEGTTYGDDYGQMLLMGNTSVNIIRIFVAAVPVVIAFVTRHYKEKESVMYNIAFNMSIVNLMTWIFASKVLYFYRLAAYFTPYMILLLCYELGVIRNERNRRIVTWTAFLCYFVYHIYSMYNMGDTFFVGYMKY